MNKLFWIDLEMTGLDVEKEVIIEVAAVITDLKFDILTSYHSVINQSEKYIKNMDNWNKTHHTESGLIDLIPKGEKSNKVEDQLIHLADTYFKNEKPILAGNSISQDRLFITKYWPRLNQKLHYRMLDVSSWKMILNHIYNIKYEKKNAHRAIEDIYESISEMKYYLKHVNITSPTP